MALIEVGGKRDDGRPQCEFQGLKRRLMVAESYSPVTLTRDHDLGQLQNGIIGSGEAAVVGKFLDFRVGEVALNNGAKIINLLRTRL